MPRILPFASDAADPFGERRPATHIAKLRILGADFRFQSNSRDLMRLVSQAYRGLPRHKLSNGPTAIDVWLSLTPRDPAVRRSEPPKTRMTAGAGLLCGMMDAANFVTLAPAARAGLVAISRRLLEYPYLARYELLEFAVYILATRVQQLVPLHAACVSRRGRAILLMGGSGTGKTTLALQCMLQGLEFMSEDSTFVCPKTLLATAVANYLHVRSNGLRFVPTPTATAWRRRSTTIQRRSGVEKLEVDLRDTGYRLSPAASRVVAIVLLTKRGARKGPLLRPIRGDETRARIEALQPYAARQIGWNRFARQFANISVWELRRGSHPADAVPSLRGLLSER